MQIEKQKPRRLQFKFWLDANRDDEFAIGWYLDTMKQKRKLTATIRDAVLLIWALREGRADTLLNLFPNVQDMINREQMARLMRGDGEG